MKIYIVSHMAEDDNTYNEHFTVKGVANKRHSELKKEERKAKKREPDEYGHYSSFMVYEMATAEIEISKTGIIDFLNRTYGRT
jgi:hypothetical protein